MVEAGRDFASTLGIDSLIGLGRQFDGLRKGINFVDQHGMCRTTGVSGRLKADAADDWLPTTSGTGSEAQCTLFQMPHS
jgi:hypothetical protein